ncbi:MAG TPA: hypothetical protein PKA19_00035 [Bacillota bacterium]|nr:hypothetical protein [Bacillota bacterium]
MKKLLSLFIAFVMLISTSTTVFADDNNQAFKSGRTSIGNYQYEVIQDGPDIIVNEYDSDVLISKTLLNVNKDDIVQEYTSSEDPDQHFSKSEILNTQALSAPCQGIGILSPAASFSTYGKYSLQGKDLLTQALFTTDALLTYYIDSTDTEGYVVKANKGQPLSVVIGVCATILVAFLTDGASFAAALAAGVLASAGVTVVSDKISANFEENVSVNATYYKTKYTNISGGGSGSVFNGKKVKVTTKKSQYYNETFYEGHAPQLYADNARTAFLNSYTGNPNASFVKMLSFKAY